jgi:hypothetical protein
MMRVELEFQKSGFEMQQSRSSQIENSTGIETMTAEFF